jgi:hypothetical protein
MDMNDMLDQQIAELEKQSDQSDPTDRKGSPMKQRITQALQNFNSTDLRSAAIGLLNALGYRSEKTLDLDNTPDAFLSEFDRRDRKLR